MTARLIVIVPLLSVVATTKDFDKYMQFMVFDGKKYLMNCQFRMIRHYSTNYDL